MRRLKALLVAIPITGILVVAGLMVGVQPANAIVTNQDYCAGYIYGFNYWEREFNEEFIRSNGEETPYLLYANDQENLYFRLILNYSC
jgi:hypothetical protein